MKTKNKNRYIINENFALIVISSEAHGKFKTKIDLDDIEKCKKYIWGINKYSSLVTPENFKYYVYGRVDGKTIFLHRFVLNDLDSQSVDHINNNTLDNRKINLQKCDFSVNCMRQKIPKSNKSGHKGVFWCANLKNPKWKAFIKIDYKFYHLGYFDKYEDAVKSREHAEREFFDIKNKIGT